jgi:hypothetical protein
MSPRKLTDADKSDILSLYREPEETTSTLAARYGVSNSTISRILKSNLVESEYEVLIQQKRSNRTPGSAASPIIEPTDLPVESDDESSPVIQTTEFPIESKTESSPTVETIKPSVDVETDDSASISTEPRRRRKRSSVISQPDAEQEAIQTELQLDFAEPVQKTDFEEPYERLEEIEQAATRGLEELLDDDLMDLDDEEDDDLEDDDLEDDEDDDLEDDWEDDEPGSQSQELTIKTSSIESGSKVRVLPLSEASLPKTCYLVVDRAAELIARPLREFSDLGRIPSEEVQEKTLPIFDNHKVARRFSNRSQRVIKVPDSRMLQKARSHLQAKGITRLLIDGQVYSLVPVQPPT